MSSTKSQQKAPQAQEHRINYKFVYLLMFTISLSSIQGGFAIAGSNQASIILEKQLGWGIEPNMSSDYYLTIISTLTVLGLAFGNILGGSVVQRGRRFAVIIFNSASVIGQLIAFITDQDGKPDFTRLCIARAIYAFSVGGLLVAIPKLIDENLPPSIAGPWGSSLNISINIGIAICMLLGLGIPDQEDEEALDSTRFWIVLYGIQIPFQILAIVIHAFILKEDSIHFHLEQNEPEKALNIIKRLYHPEEDHQAILEELEYDKIKHQLQIETQVSQPTFRQAVFGKNYWRATAMGVIISIFTQCSGVNIINLYSTTIFKNIDEEKMLTEGGDFKPFMAPKEQTYFIGCSGFFGSFLAYPFMIWFTRRGVFQTGRITMGILLCLCAIFIQMGSSLGLLICICLFVVTFQATQGTLYFVYVSEICSDHGLGISLAMLNFVFAILSAITTTMMESEALGGVKGNFYILGGFQLFAFIFLHLTMKETKGLSTQEKRRLYKSQEGEEQQNSQSII